ncbi:MAG: PadR family transcriptional regulator [Acidobacteria bacterium]|nr:PadR family transcriptional regulator [Acidobacteriota bacterium]
MSGTDVKVTVPMLYLLLTLVQGKSHGYAMGQEVARRSHDRVRLGPASLYWSVNKLREADLIREVDGPRDEGGRGRPRRYYEATPDGLRVLRDEMAVLEDVILFARDVALPDPE